MSIFQPLRRLVTIKVSLGHIAYPYPTHPPQNRKKKIEEGEAKKEKVFRNHDFSEGLNYQAGTKQGVDSEPLVHCSSQLVS